MQFLYSLLLLLHLVGFAALFGGAFVQIKAPARVINKAMLHGAITQAVTGLLLVGVMEMDGATVNHVKILVKTLVLVAIVVLVLINRKRDDVAPGAFFGVLGLTLVNAALAVFW